MARPAVDAIVRRGIDPRAALHRASIAPEALAGIENRLPAENVRALWEVAATVAGDGAFGAHVAATLPSNTLDVIEYIFASSPDLRGGLERMGRYVALVEDSASLRLVLEPEFVRLVRVGPLSTPQYDEFALTLGLVRSREASGVDWQPHRVRMHHERHAGSDVLASLFGCPVTFGARNTELVFDRALLDLPFVRSDSRLLDILERYAASLLVAMPKADTLLARASSVIAREIKHRLPTLATTAAALHLPERTLQRRLAAAGTSHSALVEDTRRELSLRYIGDASISITEIGYLLQFSEESAFYRAFKRWTGVSPSAYREHMLLGALQATQGPVGHSGPGRPSR